MEKWTFIQVLNMLEIGQTSSFWVKASIIHLLKTNLDPGQLISYRSIFLTRIKEKLNKSVIVISKETSFILQETSLFPSANDQVSVLARLLTMHCNAKQRNSVILGERMQGLHKIERSNVT